MSLIVSLFTSFFLIGAGAYGGGLVTISLIYHEVVEKRAWLSAEELNRMVTIAQMTPGPIAINAATFTGYRIAGIAGSVAATFAVVLPSVLIIALLLVILNHSWSKRVILSRIDTRRLRRAIRPGVFALFLYAVWNFGKGAVTDFTLAVIAIVGLALIPLFRSLNPVFIVFLAGIAGLFLYA